MSQSNRQRVVVFAGAGASRALPQTAFPTTVEFFKGLPESIRIDSNFRLIETYVKARKSNDQLDIEEILFELRRLLDFFHSASNTDDIVGYAIARNIVRSVNQNYTFGNLTNGGVRLIENLTSLQNQINSQVYDLYSVEPEDEELEDTWNPLIRPLFDKTFIDIFTTNYDLSIETSIQSIFGEAEYYKFCGASGKRQKYIDLSQWNESANRSTGLLTKLHGSLDWKLSRDRISLGDWVFTGDHDKQAIIYPGFKGESNAVFFVPFHDYLARSLAAADHVLIIGFAFRDEVINRIFRTSLSPRAKVTIMDPNNRLKVPIVSALNRLESFNLKAVETFIKSIPGKEGLDK